MLRIKNRVYGVGADELPRAEDQFRFWLTTKCWRRSRCCSDHLFVCERRTCMGGVARSEVLPGVEASESC